MGELGGSRVSGQCPGQGGEQSFCEAVAEVGERCAVGYGEGGGGYHLGRQGRGERGE